MSNITHFERYSIVNGNVKINIDLHKYNKRFREAQVKLDAMVMNSMEPFMPLENGTFIQNTKARSAAVRGTGKVYAAYGPQGRYLYEGKVMVDSETGKGPALIHDKYGIPVGLRFKKGAKLKAIERPLQYSRATAKPHWFDVAKKQNGNTWIKEVERTIGGK